MFYANISGLKGALLPGKGALLGAFSALTSVALKNDALERARGTGDNFDYA